MMKNSRTEESGYLKILAKYETVSSTIKYEVALWTAATYGDLIL